MRRRSRTVFKLGRQKWEQVGGKWQPVLREEHVVKEIVERLWLQAKIKVWRVRERVPGKWAPSTPGIPDLIGWVPKIDPVMPPVPMSVRHFGPIPLFIEVKRPGGAHRLAQERFIDEATAGGCLAFFAESWNDCIRELGKVGIVLTKEAA